jgi:hypothetical protein
MSVDEIIIPILRDITICEISGDTLDERSLMYSQYKEEIYKLIIKCHWEYLYFIDEYEKIQFSMSIDNVLYIGLEYINKLQNTFTSDEINIITICIFEELTSLSIDFVFDINMVYRSDIHRRIEDSRGIPLRYYKDAETFYENVGPTTTYFFYDDYNRNFVGDFLDLKKFRNKQMNI